MSATRRSVLVGAAAALASVGVPEASGTLAPRSATAADPEVGALTQRAADAHTALMRGDIARYRSLITITDDFILMSPFGGKPSRGAGFSDERWAEIGRFFRNGRNSSLELVQAYRSNDMVVLAVIERTNVEVGGLEGQDWALRVTLVFRRERGQWLLAHRHADPLAEGISLEQAAAVTRGRSPS